MHHNLQLFLASHLHRAEHFSTFIFFPKLSNSDISGAEIAHFNNNLSPAEMKCSAEALRSEVTGMVCRHMCMYECVGVFQ